MKPKTLSRTAAVFVALAIAASACSSGEAAETASPLFEAIAPTVEPEPDFTPPPTTTALAPKDVDEGVEVTIAEIGVSFVLPQGWVETIDGAFSDDVSQIGVFVIETSAATDPELDGFAPLGPLQAGGLDWSLYVIDEDTHVTGLALAEIGDLTYGVTLLTPAELAEHQLDTVVIPALQAFKVTPLPAPATSLVDGATTTAPAPAPNDHELATVLKQLIAGTDLPAVGATTFSSDLVYESAVAGMRRAGDATPVELTDKFSIGSNAKAMTVTLVARFVEEGLIGWDTTIADVFADVAPEIHPTWSSITIRQLLSHTSGLDDDRMVSNVLQIDETAQVTAQRLEIVDTVTSLELQRPPGDFAYSNIGYTIVGAMLEELTGSSWEDLIQARLFDVIGMDSCGFYAPGTPGEIDQPWGHLDELGGQPMDPGDPDADLPVVLAPAGMVHCNMADWVVFLQSQLRGFQGGAAEIIGPDSFDAIQTRPHGSDYALGWLVIDEPSGLTTLYHHGSNHRFTAEVWLVPEADWGLITVTNVGKVIADPQLQRVDQAMFERSAR